MAEVIQFRQDRALLDHATEAPDAQLYDRAMYYEILSRDADLMPRAKETVQKYLAYFVFEISRREHDLARRQIAA